VREARDGAASAGLHATPASRARPRREPHPGASRSQVPGRSDRRRDPADPRQAWPNLLAHQSATAVGRGGALVAAVPHAYRAQLDRRPAIEQYSSTPAAAACRTGAARCGRFGPLIARPSPAAARRSQSEDEKQLGETAEPASSVTLEAHDAHGGRSSDRPPDRVAVRCRTLSGGTGSHVSISTRRIVDGCGIRRRQSAIEQHDTPLPATAQALDQRRQRGIGVGWRLRRERLGGDKRGDNDCNSARQKSRARVRTLLCSHLTAATTRLFGKRAPPASIRKRLFDCVTVGDRRSDRGGDRASAGLRPPDAAWGGRRRRRAHSASTGARRAGC